jgi:hypothetical protein
MNNKKLLPDRHSLRSPSSFKQGLGSRSISFQYEKILYKKTATNLLQICVMNMRFYELKKLKGNKMFFEANFYFTVNLLMNFKFS